MNLVTTENVNENYDKDRGMPYCAITRIDTLNCQQKEMECMGG